MIRPEVLRALLEAGATAEMIVAAVEVDYEKNKEQSAKRREQAAERQRKKRARDAREPDLFVPSNESVTLSHAESRVTERDTPSLSSFPPHPPNNSPTPVDDHDGEARRDGLINPEAVRIAQVVMKIVGINPEFVPPGWCGAPMRVHVWLAEGWTEPIIRAGVEAAMARKRDGPPETIKYFEKPIRQAIAAQSAPLPNVVKFQSDHQNGATVHPITAARDRAIAHLDAIIERGGG